MVCLPGQFTSFIYLGFFFSQTGEILLDSDSCKQTKSLWLRRDFKKFLQKWQGQCKISSDWIGVYTHMWIFSDVLILLVFGIFLL